MRKEAAAAASHKLEQQQLRPGLLPLYTKADRHVAKGQKQLQTDTVAEQQKLQTNSS